MESFVKVTLKKVNILAILDCYYKTLPLIYISYDSEGIKIQCSCNDRKIQATTVIPRNSFEDYERCEQGVIAVPEHIKRLGGRCVGIEIFKIDSWRVEAVFKSDNGISYELISVPTWEMSEYPQMESSISSEQYPAAKKCLEEVDKNIEVSVNDRGATFRGQILCMSTFMIGEPGEPYCTIPGECLKLLNKFLGTTINNSRIEFCKREDAE